VLFIDDTNGSLGHYGYYEGTEGSCPADQWIRIAVTVDNVTNEFKKYVNGVWKATQDAGPELALYTRVSEVGKDSLLMFCDNSNETKAGYVNSIQFRDYVMTEAEVAALGGPTAAGIGFQDPPTHRKAPDATGDGYVDGDDLQEFVLCLTGPAVSIPPEKDLPCKNFDVDDDLDIDQDDFGAFQQYYTGATPCAPNCYYP
jgi:hypothetical protein